MHDRPHTTFDDLPLPQQAGILCNEPQFQKFAGIRCMGVDNGLTATASAEYLRTVCRVASRRELDTNPVAAQRFAALRTEYDAWRGRIATPRI
ncbi:MULTISPECIES: hypothetical protein [unclassified Sulfitobacter]|uniref:hypothetical protein n=1 Tax=unclassified Sulfitobacter TaxID=196795 RepID=UPI0007C29505|nr:MULTISPECIES: hypothetical protein [unclassified Sulfitobacter]KZX99917.1 hypothetical protein A3720_11815 [Sulfitobacter sp. HI0021]KZY00174.1 hypothetical protein A3722_11485 [Sulfitobacter sp. HI0027]KZZ00420.1 hypothetical protein A3747_05315 [Sulfitobacter sp. HI0076]